MAASTFIIAIVGTLITDWIVTPRLGTYTNPTGEPIDEVKPLSQAEKNGLFAAVLVLLFFTGLILLGTLPENGLLRDAEGSLFKGPFFKGIVAFIFLIGAFTGLAYGRVAGTLRGNEAAINAMSKSMQTMGGYMVLVFFAAQFVYYFNWTELGTILAAKGAETIRESGLSGISLLLLFILLTAIVNLFMGSASAKWALMAPIFVPMFQILGYDPALTQVAYRIGDSTTNIISPMMSYFALIIVFFQRFDPKAGIGTLVSTMLPYTIGFLIVWSIMLAIWMSLGLPYGPLPG
jgi:aminobenzoyl-glutamate transport protein